MIGHARSARVLDQTLVLIPSLDGLRAISITLAVASYRLIAKPVITMRSHIDELRMRAGEPTISPPE